MCSITSDLLPCFLLRFLEHCWPNLKFCFFIFLNFDFHDMFHRYTPPLLWNKCYYLKLNWIQNTKEQWKSQRNNEKKPLQMQLLMFVAFHKANFSSLASNETFYPLQYHNKNTNFDFRLVNTISWKNTLT